MSSIKDGAHLLSGTRATSDLVRSILISMASLEASTSSVSIKPLEDLVSFNQLENWPNLDSGQRRQSRVGITCS